MLEARARFSEAVMVAVAFAIAVAGTDNRTRESAVKGEWVGVRVDLSGGEN